MHAGTKQSIAHGAWEVELSTEKVGVRAALGEITYKW